MRPTTNYIVRLLLLGCLVLVPMHGAIVEDRFLHHFTTSHDSSASNSNATSSASDHAVNASPIVISQKSPGKKIQITISKEITGHINSPAGTSNHGSSHAGHQPHSSASAKTPVVTSLPQLHLSNSPGLVVDNETAANILQQILAGNLKNIQRNGRPLAAPPGGKPLAVIFSSAIHVVDLGELRPPAAATDTNDHPHAHQLHSHNVTAHNQMHGGHQGLNHTSLLESLLSPLISLTHLGALSHSSQQQPTISTATAIPVQSHPVQMHPVVMMVPVSQTQTFPGSQIQGVPISSTMGITSSASGASTLEDILQSLLAVKQQLLNATLSSTHAIHPTHGVEDHSSTPTTLSLAAVSPNVSITAK